MPSVQRGQLCIMIDGASAGLRCLRRARAQPRAGSFIVCFLPLRRVHRTGTSSLRTTAIHPAGRVYDAEGVGRIASRAGVPFLLDACQSAGQMPLDVAALRCDWLTGTARKYLRGPRGIGFLYASTCALYAMHVTCLQLQVFP